MTATTSTPTYKRTRYTEVVTPTLTEAVETVVVSGVGGSNKTALSTAIAQAKTDNSTTTTVNGRTVSLYSTTAQSLGDDGDSFWVELRYRANQTSVDTSATAISQTQSYGSAASAEWWSQFDSTDGDGRPNGRLRFQPQILYSNQGTGTPRPWSWQFGTETHMLPTVLSAANEQLISARLAKKMGKVNSNVVDWVKSGFTFPVKTLVFRGWRSEPLLDGNFLVRYMFVYSPYKWRQELPPKHIPFATGFDAAWAKEGLVDIYQSTSMTVKILSPSSGDANSGFIVHA